jgi:predicted anti-sigma-YlaC factor YlaD
MSLFLLKSLSFICPRSSGKYVQARLKSCDASVKYLTVSDPFTALGLSETAEPLTYTPDEEVSIVLAMSPYDLKSTGN